MKKLLSFVLIGILLGGNMVFGSEEENKNEEIKLNTVYVKRDDQLGLTCEKYTIFDQTRGDIGIFSLYDQGIIKVGSDKNNKSTFISNINNKILKYSKYQIDTPLESLKIFILEDGRIIYEENQGIYSLQIDNYGSYHKAHVYSQEKVNLKGVYTYEGNYFIELSNGFSYPYGLAFYHQSKKSFYEDFPNYEIGKSPLKEYKNSLRDDAHIEIGGNKYYGKLGEINNNVAGYDFYLYKNDEKSKNKYTMSVIGGGDIKFIEGDNKFIIDSFSNDYTLCYEKDDESKIPNDGKLYIFYEEYEYDIKGNYGNQYLEIGGKKYGPYYNIHDVTVSDSGTSFSFLVSDGQGGSTIYKDGEKLNYNKTGIIHISYQSGTTDVYYVLDNDTVIYIMKNNDIYETIKEEILIIDGIKYEKNWLRNFSVGKNGITYTLTKNELVEQEWCSSYKNEKGESIQIKCWTDKSLFGGKRIYKKVINGEIVVNFPVPDKNSNSKENQTSSTYQKKLTKKFILSKSALKKDRKTKKYISQIDKIVSQIDDTQRLEKLLTRLQKVETKLEGKIDKKSMRLKNIIDYLSGKIELRLLELEG